MRLLPIALLLFLAGCFPSNVKDQSSYFVSEVIEIPSANKDFIFGKTEEWFAIKARTSAGRLKVNNPVLGTVIGDMTSYVVVDFSLKPYSFITKVEAKDNKLRFTAQDFYWTESWSPVTRESALIDIESQMTNTMNSIRDFIKSEAIASDW